MNNRTRIVAALVLTMAVGASFAQTKYSMDDVLQMARSQSPFSKQAETRKENRYWQYKFFKSNYTPQLVLNGTLPTYSKGVNKSPQPDGTFRYNKVDQSDNSLGLSLAQPIALSGGTVSINTGTQYFNNFLAPDSIFSEIWSGTVMNIQLTQPLFAYNALRWDRKTEPLRYEESRRNYVEELEFISQQAVDRFFTVLDAQINLQLAQFNLANNDTIYKIEQGRYNIGTTTKDKLLQAELQLLRSRQDVTSARINLQNSKLDLRSYIGLKNGEEFELALPEAIPTLTLQVDEALAHARNNRADYVAFQRRKIEADREVAQARGQRFTTNLTAAYGLNNNGFSASDVYNKPTEQQTFFLTLSVPVVSWGRNKARMQTAIANQRLNDYTIAQDEVIFEQEIITQVAQFEVLLSQIEITKKSDEVAQERYLVSQNRYLIGKVDITNLNNALNEKDTAKRSYVGALRSFWSSYYALRRLTLYDFSNNKLLYNPTNKD